MLKDISFLLLAAAGIVSPVLLAAAEQLRVLSAVNDVARSALGIAVQLPQPRKEGPLSHLISKFCVKLNAGEECPVDDFVLNQAAFLHNYRYSVAKAVGVTPLSVTTVYGVMPGCLIDTWIIHHAAPEMALKFSEQVQDPNSEWASTLTGAAYCNNPEACAVEFVNCDDFGPTETTSAPTLPPPTTAAALPPATTAAAVPPTTTAAAVPPATTAAAVPPATTAAAVPPATTAAAVPPVTVGVDGISSIFVAFPPVLTCATGCGYLKMTCDVDVMNEVNVSSAMCREKIAAQFSDTTFVDGGSVSDRYVPSGCLVEELSPGNVKVTTNEIFPPGGSGCDATAVHVEGVVEKGCWCRKD